MKNKTTNPLKYGFRPPEAADALGSEKLLAECVSAGWIKPVLKRHKLTLYDRGAIAAVWSRILSGDRPNGNDKNHQRRRTTAKPKRVPATVAPNPAVGSQKNGTNGAMSAKYYKAVTAGQGLNTTQEEYETLKAALEADNRADPYSQRGEWVIDYLDGQVHIFASFTEKWWSGPPNRFLTFLGTLIAKNGLAYLEFGAAFTCDMLRMASQKRTIFRIRRNGSVWQPITVW